MRTEGDFIKINEWLLPFSWLYGIVVRMRNQLFDMGVLKSQAFNVPVISVGNITVGGSGKTPHVEYLIRLLHDKTRLAVLSRGYKRKSRGYVLADENTDMRMIGDEPFQMKQKYPNIFVAVDKKRVRGINRLITDSETKDVDVILLDDAYQHRYVKPGINILLIDYHRLIIYDKLLPAGRLREPMKGKKRADMVIVTKCPRDLKPMEYRVLTKALDLFTYQKLFFSTLKYGDLKPLYGGDNVRLKDIGKDENIMLLTGIASPKQMQIDLKTYTQNIKMMTFADHHYFSKKDIRKINETFEEMPSPKKIITTEKDATRLKDCEELSDEVKKAIYELPVEIEFMLDQDENFNNKILSYVQKNSRNSILVKRKDDNKSKNSDSSGDRPRTISFRDN